MSNTIYNNLEMYFPFIARDAVDIKENGHWLTVKLIDGSSVIYDDIGKTIRNLPLDPNDLSKFECLNEFGSRLYKIMTYKRVTQVELSERTGISRPLLSNYINNKVMPSFYNVDKIAKALDCSIDDFRYV
jgi:DNA-binding Xre family transcriptional regulator